MRNQASQLPSPDSFQERRREARREIYLGEGFVVVIADAAGQAVSGECISLSVNGMAVALPIGRSTYGFKKGDTVLLQCDIPNSGTFSCSALIVGIGRRKLSKRDSIVIGFEYSQAKGRTKTIANERRSTRIECPEFFRPLAYCEHPLFFREQIHFQVNRIGRYGLELSTSSRNKSFLLGMPLNLRVMLPMIGEFFCPAVLRSMRVSKEDNRSLVGIEFNKPQAQFISALSEFLIAGTGATLQKLRESNFEIGEIDKGLTFEYPSSAADWQAILALRFRAYKAVGKFGNAEKPEDMSDKYDGYARQIICRNNGRIIGCIRLVFVNGDIARSEHFGLGIPVPERLGVHFVEASRACTDPEYRGSDLFISLIRHTVRVAYQAGCRYLLMNCNDNMWPMYERAACRKLGVTFNAFGTTGCHLIYADTFEITAGRGGGFFGWHLIHHPMAEYLNERAPHVGLVTRSILFVHRIVDPIVKRLLRAKRALSQKKRGSK